MNLRSIAVLAIIGVLAGYVTAAQSASANEPAPIALVNVDRILKTHKPLQDKLDPLKADAKELDAAVQVRQGELETVGKQLRSARPFGVGRGRSALTSTFERSISTAESFHEIQLRPNAFLAHAARGVRGGNSISRSGAADQADRWLCGAAPRHERRSASRHCDRR